jgi:hypothetical protein
MRDFYSTYLTSLIQQESNIFSRSFMPMGEDVFQGEILDCEFCDYTVKLAKEHIYNKDKSVNPTNSMHSSAVSTQELGIRNFVDTFAKDILEGVVNSLFLNRSKFSFDSIHSYIVRYGAEYDREIGLHVDDSIVTMNLCLNDGFSGSDLILRGTRCPIHMDTENVDNQEICLKHKKGFMALHAGKNRHYVTPIESGERYNLIAWCQNNFEKNQWLEALNNNHCLDYCGIK